MRNWAELAESLYTDKLDVIKVLSKLFKEDQKWKNRFFSVKEFLGNSRESETMLDLMCGGAYPSRYLAKGSTNFFVCIDKEMDCLRFAKCRIKREMLEDKIELIQADVRCLPLREKLVDVSFDIGGLEILSEKDLTRCLGEVNRVTKRKVIFTFTSNKLRETLHYKLRLASSFLRFVLGVNYFKTYTQKEVLTLLLNQGFRNPSIHEVGYHIIVKAEV